MTRTTVAQGALFSIAARWIDRFIGLISTLILARLLLPEDFGIIAMASLVISLVDVFLDLGVNVALIQKQNPSQDHYNTAWTLRLMQTAAATLLVIVSAPLAAEYFRDPRVTAVLQVLAFSFLLTGTENIGVVTFQKEMRFGLDFRYLFLKRLIGFVATLTAAWLLRSYWALVIGTLTGRAGGAILSYVLHPMRPTLSLGKAREIFGVSQWLVLRSIGAYMNLNLHRLVVGRRENAGIMGAYTLADEIALLPSVALLGPLNRVLLPAFVEVKENRQELKRMFLLAQAVQMLIGIPAAVGLALVAHDAVRLLIGDNWLPAVPFIQWLAVANAVVAIVTNGGYVLIALGEVRTLALYSWSRVALFATVIFVALPDAGAREVTWVRAALAMLNTVAFIWLLRRRLPVRWLEVLEGAYRPLAATGVMVACVLALDHLITMPLAVALPAKIVVGAGTYGAAILSLWWLAGRPQGAERYFFNKLGLWRPRA